MSTSTLSSFLREKLQAQRTASLVAYDELLVSVVNGDKIDFDAALLIVSDAKKTAADYDNDLNRLRQIRSLEAVVSRETEVNRKLSELEAARLTEVEEDKRALETVQEQAAIRANA